MPATPEEVAAVLELKDAMARKLKEISASLAHIGKAQKKTKKK